MSDVSDSLPSDLKHAHTTRIFKKMAHHTLQDIVNLGWRSNEAPHGISSLVITC